MSILGRDDLDLVTQIAAKVAKEAIANAARGDGGVQLPVPVHRLGITTGQASVGTVVSVRVDGDTEPIPCANATGRYLQGSVRVLVMFTPSGGAYIIGTLAQESQWPEVLVQGEELTVARNNITIDNLPLDFDHLRIYLRCRNTSANDGFAHVILNGQTGATDYRYGYQQVITTGPATQQGEANATDIVLSWCPGTGTNASEWSIGTLDLYDYFEARRQNFLGRHRGRLGNERVVAHIGGYTSFGTPAVINQVKLNTDQGSFAVGTRYTVTAVGRRGLRNGLP